MSDAFDPVETLRDSGFFGGLDEAQLEALATRSIVETIPRRRTLFLAGDEADGLRIVLSGLLRVWISDSEGREITLTLVEPGDPLGELALLDGAPRSANVTAMDATRTLLIRRAPFVQLLESDPDLQRHMIQLLCERLRAATDHLGDIALLTLRRRLLRKLYELAQSHAVPDGAGARFRRQFSQSDLAAMLGVTREAVNKQLAALTTDGLIAQRDGALHITDLSELDEPG